MISRIDSLIRTYLFFIIIFVLEKPLFFIFQFDISKECSANEWLQTLWRGLPLDFSCAGYFTIIPAIFLVLSCIWKIPIQILNAYFFISLMLIFWIIIPDVDVYGYWGAHMDAPTILFYLKNPSDVASSFTATMVIRDLSLIVFCFIVFYYFYRKLIGCKIKDLSQTTPLMSGAILAAAGCLFIPIRGGFSTATMNVGRVYFSQNIFLNHAAINPVWHFLESFRWNRDFDRQYRFMDDEQANRLFNELMPNHHSSVSQALLKTNRPNILLIMLESFSGNFIEPLGGMHEVTPHLNEIFNDSIAFMNVYASGTRTDSGVVAILGGYPAQPKGRIMARPDKSLQLPSLPKKLKEAGYDLKFYYGGDENFANMRSYLIGNGFEKIIGEGHFSKKEIRTKWGIYDHVLFNELKKDLNSWNFNLSEKPFFKVILTLTSHEPFTLPVEPRFPGDDLLEKYKSSLHYSDAVLDDFMNFARTQPWWDDTLVILIADHGTPYPSFKIHEPRRYRIPMLWTGGAIAEAKKIAKIGSQTDLCATLLGQLGLTHSEFFFSKDLLAAGTPEYAFYTFSNGFGFIDTNQTVSFDCSAQRTLLEDGNEEGLLKGQAYLQILFDDLEGKRALSKN